MFRCALFVYVLIALLGSSHQSSTSHILISEPIQGQILHWSDSVAVKGEGFHDEMIIEMFFGDVPCLNVVVHDAQTLSCDNLPTLPVSYFDLTLVLDNTSVSVSNLRFANPIITTIECANDLVATSGDIQCVIKGANYLSTDDITSVVYLNNEIIEFSFLTSTQLVFSLPPGPTVAHVYVQNELLSSPIFVLHLIPVVHSVISTHGFPNAGGVWIEFMGDNFPVNDDFVEVFVGEKECTNATVTSLTKLSCLLPPGTGATHSVVVKTPLIESLPVPLIHYNRPHVIRVISSQFGTQGGNRIQIEGTDFGFTEYSNVSVNIGLEPCRDPQYVDVSVISCRLPPNKGTGLAVVVTVDGLVSTGETLISYDPPEIFGTSPGYLSLSAPLRIYGKNFYFDPSHIVLEFSPHLNCTKVEIVCAHGIIQCLGFSEISQEYLDGPIEIWMKVHVAKQVSSPFPLLLGPSLLDFQASELPCIGGTLVELHGVQFDYGAPSIYLNSLPLTNFTSTVEDLVVSNNKTMSFELPPGYGQFEIKFYINDSFGSSYISSLYGNYDAPVVLSVTSDSRPTSGNVLLSVFGRNYYGVDAPVSISFNNEQISDVKVYDDGFLTFTLPTGSGSVPLVVSLVDSFSVPFVFVFDVPTVHFDNYIEGERFILKYSKDKRIELSGSNFGTRSELINVVLTSNEVTIKCSDVELLVPHSKFSCLLDSFFSGPLSLTVVVDGLSSNPVSGLFLDPIILSVSYHDVFTDGTSIASFNGINLDLFESGDTKIVANGVQVIPLSFQPNHISFLVPPGCGVNLPIFLQTETYVSPVFSYSYTFPSVLSINAESFPTAGEVHVTLKAKNIGTCYDDLSLIIDGSPTDFSLSPNHDDELLFLLKPGIGVSLVSLVLFDQSSEHFELHYDPPVITDFVFAENVVPVLGGVPVYVKGKNFGPSDSLLLLEYVFDLDKSSTVYAVETSVGLQNDPHFHREFILFPGFGLVHVTPIIKGVRGVETTFQYQAAEFVGVMLPENSPTQGNVPVYLEFRHFPPLIEPFVTTNLQAQVFIDQEQLTSHVISNVTFSAIHFSLPAGVGTRKIHIESVWLPPVESFLSYNAPVIQQVLPDYGVKLHEPTIIKGFNFGASANEIKITISEVFTCKEVVIVEDHSELICNSFKPVEPSLAVDLSKIEPLLQVSVANQPSTINFNFAPFVVSHYAKSKKLFRQTNVLVISGFGFNRVKVPRVQFADVFLLPSIISDDTMQVSLPPYGASYTVPITLFDGERVVGEFEFEFEEPSISGLSKTLLPGEKFEIIGSNFLDIDRAEFTVKILDETVECTYTTVDQMSCLMPDVTCHNPILTVSIKNHVISFPVTFSPPYITSLSSSPAVEGSSVYFYGSFGAKQWSRLVTIDNEPVDYDFISFDKIKVTIPAGEGQKELKIITCSSLNSLYSFSYQPPKLSSFESGSPSTMGGLYTIQGAGFSSNLMTTYDSRYISSTRMQINIPPGSGKHHKLVVFVGGLVSNELTYSYQPPLIESVTRVSEKGGKIIIGGQNLGPTVEHVEEVLIGSRNCSRIEMIEPHSSISCYAPSMVKQDGKNEAEVILEISVGGQKATSLLEYKLISLKKPKHSSLIIGLIVLLAIGVLSGAFFVRPVRAAAQRVFRRGSAVPQNVDTTGMRSP
ncbi:hypothetical protein RCL1_006099 [Eukaryota sp. TZLM3-RCL]